MLNKSERFQILRTFHYWCMLGWLPVKVDLSTWKVLPSSKRWTSWMCLFWFILFDLHAIYKMAALVFWLKVGIPFHQAVVHAVLAACMPVAIYWYYVLYIKYPRLFGVYVNMTLIGNEVGVDSQRVRSWYCRLKEYTLQDIFAMSLSYMVPVACLITMFVFISNPSMKCLLYAALPKKHQTWTTFAVLLFEELRLLIVLCSIALPVYTFQVISFDLVRTKLQLLMDSMQRYGHIYKPLRHIQLQVGITNVINCYIIFSGKLLYIGLSIVTGYAAIGHFGAYPVFGIMYYMMFLNSVSVYILCYDKAFKIPALFQKVTQRAMLGAPWGNPAASKIFKRKMRSFPRVGIKVGEFHWMERESTLIFIHFVLNNIVSMLVAFMDG